MQSIDFDFIDSAIEQNGKKASSVIAIMQEVQKKYRYLPKEALIYIASQLKISPAKIYSVATFYENFSLEEKGKYIIRICDGTACHVKKSIPILNAVKKALQLQNDEKTTKDMLFTVETVSCLGACSLAPVLMIDDKVYGAMTPEKTVEVIEGISKEESHG